MLKRKAITSIKKWAQNKDHKCLVVLGARQVGKTFAIEQFAKEHYDEVIEINFKETPSAKEIFRDDLTVDNMIMAMRFRYPDKKLTAGKCLIFLDEIQECQEAITSLKFWAIDNQYDIIASGSLLGIDYNRPSSYPVGYVDYLKMYGLDFEEFLWAQGITDKMIDTVCQFFIDKKKVPDSIHSQMMSYFRTFIATGGMPEVVQKYVTTKDFRIVDTVQKAILQGYLYDIAHYASADEKLKAEKVYLTLAKQLLDKENHKFQYKEIEHGGRAQKYYSSVDWLVRGDLIHLSKLVTDVRYDVSDYERDDFFRAYATDLSLVIAMKDFAIKQHIVENTLQGNTKGGIYECAVADALHKKGHKLYFYKLPSSQKEIDMLIQYQGQVIPIEIKSSNSRATSLRSLLQAKKEIPFGYKFIDGNMGTSNDRIITVPLYMIGLLFN